MVNADAEWADRDEEEEESGGAWEVVWLLRDDGDIDTSLVELLGDEEVEMDTVGSDEEEVGIQNPVPSFVREFSHGWSLTMLTLPAENEIKAQIEIELRLATALSAAFCDICSDRATDTSVQALWRGR